MDTLLQDLKWGLRMMARNPAFVIVVVLTLALGIGANTAIFSVVNAVLLSPLPYRDPSRLVLVKEVLPKIGPRPVNVSAPDILEIQKWNHTLEAVAAYRAWSFELSGQGEPDRIYGTRVSHNLFPLLGVQPIVGRAFTADEDAPERRVAILSYGMWQSRFGGDPQVVGRTVTLDRNPFTVVGVMPKSFVFPLPGMGALPADLWVPLALTDAELSQVGDNFDFGVMARLKPGMALTQSRADLALVARRILENYSKLPGGADIQLNVVALPLGEQVAGPVKPMLLMLLGAVGFVLLIACANVANLLLARAAGRQREMAVRLALGAGRARVLRQLLVEGMLLAIAGGGLGLVFAFWLKTLLVAGMPGNIPRFYPIGIDLRVLLFTLVLAGGAGLLFGAFPAMAAWRTDLNHSLKEGGRSALQGRGHHRLRAMLVMAEVALSAVLLVGAGLLLRSFQRVLATHPGFQPDRVLTASLALPGSHYGEPAHYLSFYRRLTDRLRLLPGVMTAGASSDLPLEGSWTHLFTPEGYQPPPGAPLNLCWHSVIFGDYLQAMGIPLLRGRYFTEQDQPNSTHVLLVSESLARRYWPNEDAIGKRLKWGPPSSTDPWMTVVGVVGDVKQGPADAVTAPHSYESFAQLGGVTWLGVAVRAAGDPGSLATSLRAAVWSLDPQLSVRVRTMDQVIGRTTAARRFNLFLLGSFAALALMLAAIGIYGVMAYSVTQRTHEIGVRMALGAQGRDVIRLVLGEGARITAIGIALGAAGALALTRFLQDALYEVRPDDPATFAGVALLLGLVALTASYLPARRATRVDPMQSLRYE